MVNVIIKRPSGNQFQPQKMYACGKTSREKSEKNKIKNTTTHFFYRVYIYQDNSFQTLTGIRLCYYLPGIPMTILISVFSYWLSYMRVYWLSFIHWYFNPSQFSEVLYLIVELIRVPKSQNLLRKPNLVKIILNHARAICQEVK